MAVLEAGGDAMRPALRNAAKLHDADLPAGVADGPWVVGNTGEERKGKHALALRPFTLAM